MIQLTNLQRQLTTRRIKQCKQQLQCQFQQQSISTVLIVLVVFGVLVEFSSTQPTELLTDVFTNIEPLGCLCQDNPPPADLGHSCEDQKQWGKCDKYWMMVGDFCSVTCGRCTCDNGQQTSDVPEGCDCSNVRPPGAELSCYHQRRYGKCPADWMIKPRLEAVQGYCEYSCGRCSCPGAPDPRPTIPDTEGGPDGCQCTDTPPKGKPFTCEQQLKFGKCEAIWMFDGPLKEGYCQQTCGRCPCQPKSPPPPTPVEQSLPPPLELIPPPPPSSPPPLPPSSPPPPPSSPEVFPIFFFPNDSDMTQNITPITEIGVLDTPLPNSEIDPRIGTQTPAEEIGILDQPLPNSEQGITDVNLNLSLVAETSPPTPENLSTEPSIESEQPATEDFPFSVLPTNFNILPVVSPSPSPSALQTFILPTTPYFSSNADPVIFSCEGEECLSPSPPPPPSHLGEAVQVLSVECPPGVDNCDFGNTPMGTQQEEDEASSLQSDECIPVFQIFEESTDLAFLSFTALLKNAGYGSFLSAPVIPLTLFAPTNEAIQKTADLLGISVDELLSSPELVGQFARYHLLPAAFDLQTLVISGGPFSTFESDGVLYFERDDGTYDPDRTEYPSVRVVATGNNAHIVMSDIAGCGITVHVIDELLLPFVPGSDDVATPASARTTPVLTPTPLPPIPTQQPEQCSTVLGLLQQRNDTQIFVRLIESVADLANLFDNTDFQATFFVPTDEGIETAAAEREIDIDVFFDERAIIISLLSWSLVGELIPTNVALSQQDKSYPTLLSTFSFQLQQNASTLQWKVTGDGAGEATILEADLEACKSIVHIMDRLLIPSVQFENIEDAQGVSSEQQEDTPQNETGASFGLAQEGERVFKNQPNPLASLNITQESMEQIMSDLSQLISNKVDSAPVAEILAELQDAYVLESVQSTEHWLTILTKQLQKIGLSQKQINRFQNRALQYMQGAEPVQVYRSAAAVHSFASEQIPDDVLSSSVLQQSHWNVSDNPDGAVSRVYVAMYESVTDEDSKEMQDTKSDPVWVDERGQTSGSDDITSSASIMDDIFGETDCDQTIMDILQSRLELSTMHAIVSAYANGPLSNPNLGVTLLAPHNQAFQLLFTALNSTLDQLLEQQTTLIAIIGALTIPQKLSAQEMYQYSQVIALDGSELNVERETVLDFYGKAQESLSVQLGWYKGYVITGDIDACKSTLHIIDKVLIPSSVDEILQN
eukprot:TRINITY_DN4928_c1_g1_i5.p1 TRINITY_DN4928_c1_g1~~TRINITY_DN4928_c1_g1_i5.p1  ORF type:complete len:1221 (+),score=157.42 TRINITY_DN4928_c1_g1_i5:86-3748(+)